MEEGRTLKHLSGKRMERGLEADEMVRKVRILEGVGVSICVGWIAPR